MTCAAHLRVKLFGGCRCKPQSNYWRGCSQIIGGIYPPIPPGFRHHCSYPIPKVKQWNTTQHLKYFTSITYVQGTLESIGRILNEAGVKVAMKPVKIIGNILTSTKDSIAEHEKS